MTKDKVILKVDNISKQYRLGLVGTGTLSHDLNRWWHRIRGKEDPYLKIGEENDRSKKAKSSYVWALQDVSFQVEKGEVLGIIGKNGAGKSTLLKILSKVTGPTTGEIKSKGRIASLLEVGTGFHGEMTGRENIYLNGAILGMTKKEISTKIEDIIAFSGCERYIDTPVKRYSSGMTVRLAFAVAAFLEPEILVVDEVLAVGDADFQKKAIGKMQDLSKGEGRTVLFVSHNMAAVESLCTRVIMMQNGKLVSNGLPKDIISEYLKDKSFSTQTYKAASVNEAIGNNGIKILEASILPENISDSVIDVSSKAIFKLQILNQSNFEDLSVGFDLKTIRGEVIFSTGHLISIKKEETITLNCEIPSNFLNNITYQVHVYIHNSNMYKLFENRELLAFDVKDIKRESGYLGKVNGMVRPKLNWNIIN